MVKNTPSNAGTWVQPLVWEDTGLETVSPRALEPVLLNKRSHHNEKSVQGNLSINVKNSTSPIKEMLQ